MKKLVLLTLCIALLFTGCGQVVVLEADTRPTMIQEEVIPATGTQTVPMEIAGEAVEPVASEAPTQPQQAPSVAPLEDSVSTHRRMPKRRTRPRKRLNLCLIQTWTPCQGNQQEKYSQRIPQPATSTPSWKLCVWATSTPRHSTV